MGCYSITGYSPAFYQVDPTSHCSTFIHLGGERHCAQHDPSKGSNLNPTSSSSALTLLMQLSGNQSISATGRSYFQIWSEEKFTLGLIFVVKVNMKDIAPR